MFVTGLLSLFPTVRQLHREFLRAGADVMQTFTFYASDDKLKNRGNTASEKIGVRTITANRNCKWKQIGKDRSAKNVGMGIGEDETVGIN